MEIQTTRVTSGFFDRKVGYFKKSLEKVGYFKKKSLEKVEDFKKSPLKKLFMWYNTITKGDNFHEIKT